MSIALPFFMTFLRRKSASFFQEVGKAGRWGSRVTGMTDQGMPSWILCSCHLDDFSTSKNPESMISWSCSIGLSWEQ
jgi:hypothetical protein